MQDHPRFHARSLSVSVRIIFPILYMPYPLTDENDMTALGVANFARNPRLISKGLLGDPLNGSAPVYYIYLDESGTNKKHPATIVAGIIVKPDDHWRAAQEHCEALFDKYVPKQLRNGFVFHAVDVWNKKEYWDFWPIEDRSALISEMAAIPRKINAAISMAMVRRTFYIPLKTNMKLVDFHHIMSFGRCVARANKYVSDQGGPK